MRRGDYKAQMRRKSTGCIKFLQSNLRKQAEISSNAGETVVLVDCVSIECGMRVKAQECPGRLLHGAALIVHCDAAHG